MMNGYIRQMIIRIHISQCTDSDEDAFFRNVKCSKCREFAEGKLYTNIKMMKMAPDEELHWHFLKNSGELYCEDILLRTIKIINN